MLELLRKYYPESYHDRQIKLKMTLGGNQPPKYLTLILSSMILDRGQYRVATFLDETDHRTLARVEQENQLL